MSSEASLQPRPRQLYTVQQFCQQHPAFTQGALRWLLFHRKTNGLTQAVIRVGRRVLIDDTAFFVWIDGQDKEESTKELEGPS